MQIINASKTEYGDAVTKAVAVLNAGGLVIYPTETCYGVAADATNPESVKKLLDYKRRPEGKAVSVAVCDRKMAAEYVKLNSTARQIYKKFLPGPVTVVSQSRGKVIKELEAEDGSLGVRIPDYKLALEIVRELGRPITATSANSAGKKTPYAVADILDNITIKQKELLDLILDAGELPHNPPSTVIDTTKEELKILRRGDMNFGQILVEANVNSEELMQEAGAKLIRQYQSLLEEKCLLIMFNADLGAGKTQFIKGMATELRIKTVVNSPTFVLLKEYEFVRSGFSGMLVHLDAWRLESVAELAQFDLPQYFKPGNVVAVEWAGMAREYLESVSARKDVVKVYIEIAYKSLQERFLKIYE